MITMEQKIDIILRYIATENESVKAQLKEEAFNALLSDTTPKPVYDDPEDILDDVIEDLLKEIGIPYHLVGHEHIHVAIKLVISDRKYMDSMTKLLYTTVAARCDSTAVRVERGIRHAIECVWNSRDLDNAFAIFGNTLSIMRGRPTNGEFISACVKEVKRRMKNR